MPGKIAANLGSTECNSCEQNTVAKEEASSLCVDCLSGQFAAAASATCTKCSAGRYGVGCVKCPSGFKRGEDDEDLTTCVKCQPGEITHFSGATTCDSCDVGKKQVELECVKCQAGEFQNTKGQTECSSCPGGLIPNNATTDCIKPEWKVVSDCDYTTQYLNMSSSNRYLHTCAPCPLGASCEGNIGWSKVRAKYGWWRVLAAEDLVHPPNCLLDAKLASAPPCAFTLCLFPHACLGAKNPGRFVDFTGHDPATIDRNESCATTNVSGYQQDGCDNSHHPTNSNSSRCRLCGTCQFGFKRSGSGTKCKQCPDPTTNKILLGVGFVVMIIGSAVLVYMTIKEEGGADDVSE
jgi:hypothetical protein